MLYIVIVLSILVHLLVDIYNHTNNKEEIALDVAFVAIDAGFLASSIGNLLIFGYFNCWVISAYGKLIATLEQTQMNDNGRLLDAQTLKDVKITAITTFKNRYNCLTNWKLVLSSIFVLAMGVFSFMYNKSFYIAVPLLGYYSVMRGVEIFLCFQMRSWTSADQQQYSKNTGTVYQSSHNMV